MKSIAILGGKKSRVCAQEKIVSEILLFAKQTTLEEEEVYLWLF